MFEDKGMEKLFPYLLCIEMPEDLMHPILGDRTRDKYNIFDISFYPCSNPICPNYTEILKRQIFYLYPKLYFKHSNYTDPIQRVTILKEQLAFEPNTGKMIFHHLRENMVVDQTNWLQTKHENRKFTDLTKEEYITYARTGQITCTEEQIASQEYRPYLSVTYRHSGVTDVITRSYKELQTSVGEIGGFKEVVFFAFAFFYTGINKFFMRKFLVEQLLPKKNLLSLSKEKERIENMSNEIATSKQTKTENVNNEEPKPNDESPGTALEMKDHPLGILLNVGFNRNNSDSNSEASDLSKSQQKDLDSLEKSAFEHIENLTELVTIVQELSSWQLFKHIMFEDYQLKLLPVVEIEVSKRIRKALEGQKIKDLKDIFPLNDLLSKDNAGDRRHHRSQDCP